ncbi:TetR/AcrR family transcriptional regulator [Streptomyces cinereoruber]|nr:TetR/AcrR family transcriptional regulator [Streptomyces cinereoruber]MBB4158136.1 AcrR family transcriptional regulator [Streptomyces cinereoruber]MBY8819328.1 TetR/AcrR family transcriptional regulator [Streptomyces cinereoruber]NIH61711.1 AcrR family transcriptional regulator [Streptomyces cinereoruber]
MERRRAILDAAEALLREQGYEAATLKAVGERAGIPVASMYHYFPDRHQVDAELLRRHLRAIEELVTAALEGSPLSTLREAADAVIDPLRDYFREHPSCVELWFSGRSEALAVLVREFDAVQADRFWRLLVERGLVSGDTPRLALQLAFEVGNRLFDVAFRQSPAGDDATIDEVRRMVIAYLKTYAA